MSSSFISRSVVLVLALASSLAAQEGAAPGSEVLLKDLGGKIRVTIDGELFTDYHYESVPRPICHPVIGPSGLPMTRGWPMELGPNETRDHPHHRSLWFAHGKVNGHDFWSVHPRAGKVVQKTALMSSGGSPGVLTTTNAWIAHDKTTVCTDRRTLTFWQRDGQRFLDYEVTLIASNGELVLGDTKEGTMALRLRPELRLEGKVARGMAINSEGVKGLRVWGRRANWVDYNGLVGKRVVGVAMFDHPSNHAHPTWWHARHYGLFAANPFGRSDFEKAKKGAGDVTIAAGKELTLLYRIVFHDGDQKQAGIERLWKQFEKHKSPRKSGSPPRDGR